MNVSPDFVPWARLGRGRGMLIIPDGGRAWIEPTPPTVSACEHPAALWTGYGFPRSPSRLVPVCPDCLAIVGDVVIRDR